MDWVNVFSALIQSMGWFFIGYSVLINTSFLLLTGVRGGRLHRLPAAHRVRGVRRVVRGSRSPAASPC